jgi:cell wall-associated NlpC family hydrolase
MVFRNRFLLSVGILLTSLLLVQCGGLQPVSSSRASAGTNASRLEPISPRGKSEKPLPAVGKKEETEEKLVYKKRREEPSSGDLPSPLAPPVTEDITEDSAPAPGNVREGLIGFARKYKGTPYKYGGKDPRGFDCSGFTRYVYKKFAVLLPGNSGMQAREVKKLASVKEAKPGDLLFFSKQPNGRGEINHVGLIVKVTARELIIIHSTSRGVVEENVALSPYWSPRVLYAGEIPGL